MTAEGCQIKTLHVPPMMLLCCACALLLGCNRTAADASAAASATAVVAVAPSLAASEAPAATVARAWWCDVADDLKVACLPTSTAAKAPFAAAVPKLDMDAGAAQYRNGQGRDVVVALLFAGRDVEARKYLNRLDGGRTLIGSERQLIDGHVANAVASYLGSAGVPTPPMTEALKDVNAGNLDAALAVLEQPYDFAADESDMYQNEGVVELARAAVYATRHQWPRAYAMWDAAAVANHTAPKTFGPDEYNNAAVEMMYYYRGHIADSDPGR